MPPSFRLRSPRLIKTTENDVEKQLTQWLLLRGWYPIRQHSGLFRTPDGRYLRVGEPGIPDYVVLHAHFPAFLLETKAPGGKLTPDQERKRWALTTAYGLAVAVADSLEKLKLWLEQHERKTKERL